MGWVNRAGEPVLRNDRELLGLRLGQRRVSGDDGDGRILARPAFRDRGQRRGRHGGGKAQSPELAVHFEGGGPELRSLADIDAAAGVDRNQRPDRVAVAGERGGRAQPALEVDGGGAETRPGGAEREGLARLGGGRVAEVAVGRKASPVLVATVEQIEQRGAANERHADVSDGETATALAQQRLDAGGGVETEG